MSYLHTSGVFHLLQTEFTCIVYDLGQEATYEGQGPLCHIPTHIGPMGEAIESTVNNAFDPVPCIRFGFEFVVNCIVQECVADQYYDWLLLTNPNTFCSPQNPALALDRCSTEEWGYWVDDQLEPIWEAVERAREQGEELLETDPENPPSVNDTVEWTNETIGIVYGLYENYQPEPPNPIYIGLLDGDGPESLEEEDESAFISEELGPPDCGAGDANLVHPFEAVCSLYGMTTEWAIDSRLYLQGLSYNTTGSATEPVWGILSNVPPAEVTSESQSWACGVYELANCSILLLGYRLGNDPVTLICPFVRERTE